MPPSIQVHKWVLANFKMPELTQGRVEILLAGEWLAIFWFVSPVPYLAGKFSGLVRPGKLRGCGGRGERIEQPYDLFNSYLITQLKLALSWVPSAV